MGDMLRPIVLNAVSLGYGIKYGREVVQGALYQGFTDQLLQRRRLEGGTNYAAAMYAVRNYYFPDAGGQARTTPRFDQVPVYVMFVTDGSPPRRATSDAVAASVLACFALSAF